MPRAGQGTDLLSYGDGWEGHISYGPDSLEVRFDSGILAGYTNPVVAAATGTLIEPNDIVPNSPVPEPSAAATVICAGTLLGLWHIKTRRRQK